AKKKYALLDEKGKMKITGFETVRRNWSILAKEVQEQVLRLILEDKKSPALEYVQAMIKELKAGQVDISKLVLRTQITRELSQYISVGPHVYAARKRQAQGEKIYPGMVIDYFIAKGSGLVRERAALPEEARPYDPDYYLYHQLLPSVIGIFDVVGITEDEILGRSKQMGLGKFF
ncbi:MAG TPA: DNA polymerase domain-containing protein, partial [Candidatus Nanoarchaeia archaeon]|nr:DNA polymerase domain-containing protein [Candidatus Nanoarchaeia archaeon]